MGNMKHEIMSLSSILILKYKRFYDGGFKLSVELKDRGQFGVLFRVVDQFNYYSLILDSDKQQKRFIKMINGKEQILSTKEDGGYLINQWYRIRLEYKVGLFRLFMKEENKVYNEQDDNDMPLVMEGYDTTLSVGSVGVGVNQISLLQLDRLEVEPYRCQSGE